MNDENFIIYTQSHGPRSLENRRRVARFIGKNVRNRSAPSTKTSCNAVSSRVHARLASAKDRDRRDTKIIIHPESLVFSKIYQDGGGIREDPFDAFPTKHKNTMAAIDYYVHIYGPTHLIGSDALSNIARIQVVQDHLRDIIKWPVTFEATLALAYSNLAVLNTTPTTLNTRALSHYSKAVSLLRSHIDDGRINDAMLLSIISLIGVNYLWNDLHAFQANLKGLRQIVTLRGGLDNLGFRQLLKPAILTIESFWIFIRSQTHLLPRPSVPALRLDIATAEEEVYESLATKLPPGFRSLAQQRRLSLSVIEIILQEARFSSTIIYTQPTGFIHHDGVRKFAHLRTRAGEEFAALSDVSTLRELARLLANPYLLQEDLICCIGLFVNSLCVLQTEQLSPIYFKQIQHYTKLLIDCHVDEADRSYRDLLLWTIFNVTSTMVPSRGIRRSDSPMEDLRNGLLVKIAAMLPNSTWHEVDVRLRRFFCSDTCSVVFANVWRLAR